MSKKKKAYQWILDDYPEFISKEQLYKICKVSKKTALHYLKNGLIPCENSGKKTRQYTIRTTDVISFLQKRDENPDAYGAPIGWYSKNHVVITPRVCSPRMQHKIKRALQVILTHYPDVLSSRQAAEITGYHHQTIVRWCYQGKLEHLTIGKAYLIPQRCLTDCLLADQCQGISKLSKQHILRKAAQFAGPV